MNYKEFIKALEEIASEQPYIHTIIPFDPYKANEYKELTYGVFSWSPGSISESNGIRQYNINLFVFDRLFIDQSNKLDNQSFAIEVLKNIIDSFEDKYELDTTQRTFTTFYEQFKDVCAGAYVNITFSIPIGDCYEEY